MLKTLIKQVKEFKKSSIVDLRRNHEKQSNQNIYYPR